jgi:RNA polymerase sigma-70 factor (ECF subfamily)
MKVVKSNKELLILIREGDMIAFYNIYERYCKRLYGFVLRYIKNEADAEEIVQDVFVKIWEARSKIDVYSSFESFLFTIAYNSTISLFRKRVSEKKYLEYLKLLQHLEKAPDLIDEIQFNDLNSKVQALLNELTQRQKEIFLLSREEGLSHEEIAKKLNISINTVKKHMVNTLAFLRSGLGSGLMVNLLFASLFI